jgi:pantoate kinase
MALPVMATPISISKSYSPGHVTGFFEPQSPDNISKDELQRGSKGVGFCIDRGIQTTVRLFEADISSYDVVVSGYPSGSNEVSKWVIRYFLDRVDKPLRISVTHDAYIPIGFGLGASGAGALSLSYALNEALQLGMTKESAAQIAHKAEIVCKTGLGTVMSEFTGGFDIRTASGAPGIGSIRKISLSNYKAIILCIAPISTKMVLTSHEDKLALSQLGNKMMKRFMGTPTVNNFLQISYEFSNSIRFIDDKCRLGMKLLRSGGFGCGVALFGKTIFTLVPGEAAERAMQCLKNLGGILFKCDIDTNGAIVLRV